jgi:hypothetical protein
VPDLTASPTRPVRGVGLGVAITVLAMAVAVACAKVEDQPAAPSHEKQVTYVAVKLIPAGKTMRAAKADGSIELEEVPADVVAGEGIDDIAPIECLVAGRALPSGTVLKRAQFVDASELGLEQGLTDGTTVDSEC